MAERAYTIGEAIAILKSALGRHGLGEVKVTVNSHWLTPVKSGMVAREILLGGFGENVGGAGRDYRYGHRRGKFSWITVEQGGDAINLFYDFEGGGN